MSKQLAISAASSVFAMAAFALLWTPAQRNAGPDMATGAAIHAAAPAYVRQAALPLGI